MAESTEERVQRRMPILQGKRNFSTWKRKMEGYLDKEGLLDIAEGKEKGENAEGDALEGEELEKFNQRKKDCYWAILDTLGNHMMSETRSIERGDAHKLYQRVIHVCTAATKIRRQDMLSDFWALEQGDNESCHTYCNRVLDMKTDMINADTDTTDDDFVFRFIAGINDKWETAKDFLTSRQSDYTLETAVEYLRDKEKAKNKKAKKRNARRDRPSGGNTNHHRRGTDEAEALNTFVGKGKPRKKNKQWKGHKHQGQPYDNRRKNQFGGNCDLCKERGHKAYQCPIVKQLVAMEVGSSSRQGQTSANYAEEDIYDNEECGMITTEDITTPRTEGSNTEEACTVDITDASDTWVLDSGATSHMHNQQDAMHNIRKCAKSVKMANHHTDKIESVGDVDLHPDTGITLRGTLLVPHLRKPLMSVAKLTSMKEVKRIVYEDQVARVIGHDNKVLIEAKRRGDLYYVVNNGGGEYALHSSVDLKNTMMSLHLRLGHASYGVLKSVVKNGLIDGLGNVDLSEKLPYCDGCAMGKATRVPHPSSNTPEPQEKLYLIHVDEAGPMETESIIGRKRYYLLIVDTYTNMMFVYFLRHKNDGTDALINFIRWAENQTSKTVKIIRSDGGGEFINKRLKGFAKVKGFTIETTIRYTPEQNGKVERANRTIIQSARSSLLGAMGTTISDPTYPKLGLNLWAEAVNYAVEVRNRLPSRALPNNVTPYELWYDKKPNLSLILPFGCRVHYTLPKELRKKWSACAKEGIYVGPSVNKQGVRIFDPSTRRIIDSCDITYDERGLHYQFHINKPKANILFSDSPRQELSNGATSIDYGALVEKLKFFLFRKNPRKIIISEKHGNGGAQHSINKDARILRLQKVIRALLQKLHNESELGATINAADQTNYKKHKQTTIDEGLRSPFVSRSTVSGARTMAGIGAQASLRQPGFVPRRNFSDPSVYLRNTASKIYSPTVSIVGNISTNSKRTKSATVTSAPSTPTSSHGDSGRPRSRPRHVPAPPVPATVGDPSRASSDAIRSSISSFSRPSTPPLSPRSSNASAPSLSSSAVFTPRMRSGVSGGAAGRSPRSEGAVPAVGRPAEGRSAVAERTYINMAAPRGGQASSVSPRHDIGLGTGGEGEYLGSSPPLYEPQDLRMARELRSDLVVAKEERKIGEGSSGRTLRSHTKGQSALIVESSKIKKASCGNEKSSLGNGIGALEGRGTGPVDTKLVGRYSGPSMHTARVLGKSKVPVVLHVPNYYKFSGLPWVKLSHRVSLVARVYRAMKHMHTKCGERTKVSTQDGYTLVQRKGRHGLSSRPDVDSVAVKKDVSDTASYVSDNYFSSLSDDIDDHDDENNCNDFYEFAYQTTDSPEPTTYKQAMQSPDSSEWTQAIESELLSLEANKTFSIVPKNTLHGRRLVGCKWVFKVKRGEDGLVDRYKARLVAQGFTQTKGIDFFDTFAPVARLQTVRLVVCLAVQYGLKLFQIDVDTAYLYGVLKEDIFMKLPPGREQQYADAYNRKSGTSFSTSELAFQLHKCLYGLKQSGREWNEELNKALTSFGLSRCISEPCLYSCKRKGTPVFVSVYVDDIVVASSETNVRWLYNLLKTKFSLKELEPLHWCLGLRIRDQVEDDGTRSISIDQSQYCLSILDRFGMSDSKPQSTPMDASLKLTLDQSPQNEVDIEYMRTVPYREAVGSLMYLMCGTRPDLCYVVGLLGQFSSNPGRAHWQAVKRVLRYVRGTVQYGLVYRSSPTPNHTPPVLEGHVDADWAGDLGSRRSTSGYMFTLGGGVLCWASKRQKSVSLSTAEAEYVAASVAGQEAQFLRGVLHQIGVDIPLPITIKCDNQSCIRILENPCLHTRAKHIDIRYHFVRDLVRDGALSFVYCPSRDNVADVFTKALCRDLYETFRNTMLQHIDD